MVDNLVKTEGDAVPPAGTVIVGRYVVERVLGAGGMGAVVAARDLAGDRTVAIKFLLPSCAEDEQAIVRFEREARATERLRSEHVRRVHEIGMDAAGRRYLVMEYLEGEDLRAIVRREGPLDPERAADYVAQACHALAEAHALGIVHRDLKPANLFLARRADGPPRIKIVDFGVAKFDSPNVAGDARDMTAAQMVLGSRHFMAPEQILAPRSVDALADVWALGAILYYLLAGKTPFAAPTPEEVTMNMLCDRPHPLLALRPDAPPHLVAVVSRCLERDRARRFPNVIELLRALDTALPVPVEREQTQQGRSYLIRTVNLADVQLPPPPVPQVVVQVTAPPPRVTPAPAPPRRFDGVIPFFTSAAAGAALTVAVLSGRGSWTRPPEIAAPQAALVVAEPGGSASARPTSIAAESAPVVSAAPVIARTSPSAVPLAAATTAASAPVERRPAPSSTGTRRSAMEAPSFLPTARPASPAPSVSATPVKPSGAPATAAPHRMFGADE
ncbi:MAG: protein kinase [Minicystis sp.]